LRSRDCLTADGEITNVGVLAFGREPQKFIRKAYVTVVRYPEPTITDTILDSKDFNGNLFDQIDQADQYLREHIQVISKIPKVGLARQDTPVYPYFVLRELLVNAVAHRDYRIYGSRVLIQMFADRIEFYSPGSFLPGITAENLRESQRSRNPAIASVLHDVKYLEEFGNGIDRIYETIENYPLKLQPPVWKDIGAAVITTLYDPTYEKEKKIEDFDFSQLNERQRMAIDYIRNSERITNSEYRQMARVSNFTANQDLGDLLEKGLIISKGAGRSVYYVLA
jgi:ATP-dependent DNA helicase RecG